MNTAFIIQLINTGSIAKQTPLRVGDILVEINGQELDCAQAIAETLKSSRPGSSVELCILRGETLENVTVLI